MTTPVRPRGPRARLALAAVTAAIVAFTPSILAGALVPLQVIVAPVPSDTATVHDANLAAVSCNSPSLCVAVGRYESKTGGRAYLLTKNTVWGAPRPALLPGDALAAANATLNGVSCPTFGYCVAVGQYETAIGYRGFIMTETGGIWHGGTPAPVPGDAIASPVTGLNAVSCVTVTTCVAVGQYTNPAGNQGLISWEFAGHWTKARIAPLPPRAKPNFITHLDGVSCPKWGDCVAVGTFVNTNPARKAMILTESAGVWVSSVNAKLPSDAHYNPWAGLFGVKCTGVGNCVAVGVYQGPNHGQGLIVNSIGGVWGTGLLAPLPPGYNYGANASQLLAVSCTSLGNCVAVGQFTAGQIDRGVMINERHGGWGQVQLTPHPANAIAPYFEGLNGVSCTTALIRCSMVGQYQAVFGQPAHIVTK